METQDFTQKFLKNQKELNIKRVELSNKIENLKERILKIEKQLQNAEKKEYLWTTFVNDIMSDVSKKLNLNFSRFENTLGLGCRCPLSLKDKDTQEIVYSITFLPPNEYGLEYEDNKKRVDFNPDSIASLNGFGNSTSTIKFEDVTSEKIIEILKEIKKNLLEN